MNNTDKSKGYILKDGSYSKKLRVNSLQKVELMEDKWLYYNGFNKNFFKTTRLPLNEFVLCLSVVGLVS